MSEVDVAESAPAVNVTESAARRIAFLMAQEAVALQAEKQEVEAGESVGVVALALFEGGCEFVDGVGDLAPGDDLGLMGERGGDAFQDAKVV